MLLLGTLRLSGLEGHVLDVRQVEALNHLGKIHAPCRISTCSEQLKLLNPPPYLVQILRSMLMMGI